MDQGNCNKKICFLCILLALISWLQIIGALLSETENDSINYSISFLMSLSFFTTGLLIVFSDKIEKRKAKKI